MNCMTVLYFVSSLLSPRSYSVQSSLVTKLSYDSEDSSLIPLIDMLVFIRFLALISPRRVVARYSFSVVFNPLVVKPRQISLSGE